MHGPLHGPLHALDWYLVDRLGIILSGIVASIWTSTFTSHQMAGTWTGELTGIWTGKLTRILTRKLTSIDEHICFFEVCTSFP